MITRSIGKIVRGRCTPFQIVVASVLGAALGFSPGFGQAPGLVLFLAILLAILNANLFVAGLVGAGAQLLSLVALPLSFQVGRFLLDGPTSDLFRTAINAPVLAYFGFERYVTSGGLALGLALGCVVGLILARTQSALRGRLAKSQEDSERVQELTSKSWVRFGTYILFGKKPKKGYGELQAKRIGNPIRIVGFVGVTGALGLVWTAQAFLGSAYLQNTLQRGLERANGATVDLGALDLDLAEGRFALEGLALADRNELTRDAFRGRAFEADLSTRALLQKRLVIERLVVREASSGAERAIPGKPIDRGTDEEAGQDETDAGVPGKGDMTLEDVLADVDLWRDRLSRVRRMLSKLGQDSEDVGVEGAHGQGDAAEESLSDRLKRRAEKWGYTEVIATHLFDAQPRVQVNEIVIEGFRIADFPDELFELRIENLSSAPSLLIEGARISLSSRDENILFAVDLGQKADEDSASRHGRIQLALRGMQVDGLASGVVVDGQRVIEGGTIDVELDGSFLAGVVDLPLNITLYDSNLRVPGYNPTAVERFALPIGVHGALDAPSISLDDGELVDALVQAGKDELARRVNAEVDARLADARAELDGRVSAELDELGNKLSEQLEEQGLDLGVDLGGDLLGLEEHTSEATERAAGFLGGMLGRKD